LQNSILAPGPSFRALRRGRLGHHRTGLYSDAWQLVINTGTTIINFLTVFLIQNMQSRETRIVTLKLSCSAGVGSSSTHEANRQALGPPGPP
jgi:hypothetical protein